MKWSQKELEFINTHESLIESYPDSDFKLKEELISWFGYAESIDRLLIGIIYLSQGPKAFIIEDCGSSPSKLRVELRSKTTHLLNSVVVAKTGYPGESVGDIPQSEVREAIKNELAKAFNYKEVYNLIMDISGNCGIDKNLYLMGLVDGKEEDFV